MKGGFYGVRAKQLSLILITLVCMSILLWGWQKSPFLTSLLPPQTDLLQLSPEVLSSAPNVSSISSKPYSNTIEDISKVGKKGMLDKQDGHDFTVAGRVGSAKGSPESTRIEINATAIPVVKTGGISAGSEKELVHGQEKHGLSASALLDDPKNFSGKTETNEITTPGEEKACSYTQGEWVTDDSRPLYSGFNCKQWLSEMWACRLTQRTDFAYEKLQWKPKNCKMEEFTASKFLRRMQDKTLAFVGDSLGRQQFQSLMCMITGGEERTDVINVGKEYGLVKAHGAIRPDGWAYRFPITNTTILYYWSASLCDLEPLDRATDFAMHLDRPPAFLRLFLHKFDILVLNTGHHWNRGKIQANRWIMYVGGMPNTNIKIADIAGAKNFTVYSIVNWVNSQLPNYPGLKAFFRSLSPRHFFNGDWNTGGTCDNTTPLAGSKAVLRHEPGDPLAAAAVKGTKVQLLDITALSQLRDEGHISKYSIKATPRVQDCLHWCLPGVPDTWNEILFAQI